MFLIIAKSGAAVDIESAPILAAGGQEMTKINIVGLPHVVTLAGQMIQEVLINGPDKLSTLPDPPLQGFGYDSQPLPHQLPPHPHHPPHGTGAGPRHNRGSSPPLPPPSDPVSSSPEPVYGYNQQAPTSSGNGGGRPHPSPPLSSNYSRSAQVYEQHSAAPPYRTDPYPASRDLQQAPQPSSPYGGQTSNYLNQNPQVPHSPSRRLTVTSTLPEELASSNTRPLMPLPTPPLARSSIRTRPSLLLSLLARSATQT
jgi:hypothetical protein